MRKFGFIPATCSYSATIGPKKVWDEKAIRKRAKWLHKQVVRVWPHATDMNVD